MHIDDHERKNGSACKKQCFRSETHLGPASLLHRLCRMLLVHLLHLDLLLQLLLLQLLQDTRELQIGLSSGWCQCQ